MHWKAHNSTSVAALPKASLLYYYKCVTSILSREDIGHSLIASVPTILLLIMWKHKADKRTEQYSSMCHCHERPGKTEEPSQNGRDKGDNS